MHIHFAPLQGYTDDVYRRIHNELVGGVHCYYTPFMRIEGGGVRAKDLRDIRPEWNQGVNVVSQIIANSRKEFDRLCDIIIENGYKRIDINMGCPFPLQTRHGRGCGLLQHPDIVAEIMQRVTELTEQGNSQNKVFSFRLSFVWDWSQKRSVSASCLCSIALPSPTSPSTLA